MEYIKEFFDEYFHNRDISDALQELQDEIADLGELSGSDTTSLAALVDAVQRELDRNGDDDDSDDSIWD